MSTTASCVLAVYDVTAPPASLRRPVSAPEYDASPPIWPWYRAVRGQRPFGVVILLLRIRLPRKEKGYSQARVAPGSCGARCGHFPYFPWCVRGFSPRQGVELGERGGLILLHREHGVRAEFLDEVTGVGTLGVQCVGSHHDPSHIHGGQQRLETSDLVSLPAYFSLSHNDSTVVGHRRQQMHATLPGVSTDATQRLAVHRNRPNAGVLAATRHGAAVLTKRVARLLIPSTSSLAAHRLERRWLRIAIPVGAACGARSADAQGPRNPCPPTSRRSVPLWMMSETRVSS